MDRNGTCPSTPAVAAEAPAIADPTRPLVLGYACAHLLMTQNELAAVKHDLNRFAHKEGYTLGTVFVERVDRAPAAFGALLETVQRAGADGIVIPSMQHLGALGIPSQLVYYLQTVTGVRVLIADGPP